MHSAVAGATRFLSRSATPHLRAGLMNGVALRLFGPLAPLLCHLADVQLPVELFPFMESNEVFSTRHTPTRLRPS